MNYHDIKHNDMLNGDGLRVTLFVSGCSLNCRNCQNPQAFDKNSGILFDEEAKREIFTELDKNYISGITLTGGHPLEEYNLKEVYLLCKEIKEKYKEKTIWLYTGFTFEKVKDFEILKLIDVLVDGPFVEELKDLSLKWRGSKNQRVIDVQKTLKNNQIVLWCD